MSDGPSQQLNRSETEILNQAKADTQSAIDKYEVGPSVLSALYDKLMEECNNNNRDYSAILYLYYSYVTLRDHYGTLVKSKSVSNTDANSYNVIVSKPVPAIEWVIAMRRSLASSQVPYTRHQVNVLSLFQNSPLKRRHSVSFSGYDVYVVTPSIPTVDVQPSLSQVGSSLSNGSRLQPPMTRSSSQESLNQPVHTTISSMSVSTLSNSSGYSVQTPSVYCPTDPQYYPVNPPVPNPGFSSYSATVDVQPGYPQPPLIRPYPGIPLPQPRPVVVPPQPNIRTSYIRKQEFKNQLNLNAIPNYDNLEFGKTDMEHSLKVVALYYVCFNPTHSKSNYSFFLFFVTESTNFAMFFVFTNIGFVTSIL